MITLEKSKATAFSKPNNSIRNHLFIPPSRRHFPLSLIDFSLLVDGSSYVSLLFRNVGGFN